MFIVSKHTTITNMSMVLQKTHNYPWCHIQWCCTTRGSKNHRRI